MVAGIVNRGLINDELFFDSNGEIWVVWDRMRSIVPTWRAAFKNPHLFHNIEETCKRLEAWRRKAPSGPPAARRPKNGTPQTAGKRESENSTRGPFLEQSPAGTQPATPPRPPATQ